MIQNHDLKELLIKCWMTHDGMWFFHCLKECGIEKTNKINKAAVKSMSKIEIKRIQELFEIEKIEKFADLQNIMNKAMKVFKADFMDFTYNFPEKNKIHCEMSKCWAYDGITRMGVIENYQCAIYSRVEGWFEALNIDYNVSPALNGCLMYDKGECVRDYTFYFKE
ncbi:MAG: DUF6125 family protein [Candidatus Thorarchaeota archaeon]